MIRADIDRAIAASVTERDFYDLLESWGYEFKFYGESGQPLERPSMDLVSILKHLQQINNNMNQIAMKANSLNFVDTAAYWENIESLEDLKGKLLEVMYG